MVKQSKILSTHGYISKDNTNDVSLINNETNHIETNSSSKKKKRKKEIKNGTQESEPDLNMGLSEADQTETDPGINDTASGERKKKKKMDKEIEKIEIKERIKTRRKDVKQELEIIDRQSNENNVSVVDTQTNEISRSSKKRKREKSLKDSKNEDETQESLPKKKRKNNEKLSNADSSLGLVDVDILQQAGTNMGLPLADETEVDPAINNSGSAEKKKRKKEKHKGVETPKADIPPGKSRNEKALDYVRLWSSSRKSWKFCKMLQVHLLHIMYDKSLVSDEDFEVVLQYLEGLAGKAKDKTREEAEKVLKEEKPETVTAEKEERARQILQILS